MTGTDMNDDTIRNAIWGDRLADVDDHLARATCAAIGAATGSEVEEVVSLLAGHRITATTVGDPTRPAQRQWAAIEFASGDEALTAAKTLTELGYRSWDPIDGPAGAIHRRLRSSLTLARTTDATTVIEFRWPEPTGLAGRLPSAAVPNENDYEVVSLPTALWPLYLLIRPLRLVGGRLGLRLGTDHRLGPFLGTPRSLVEPLLDLAGITADDVLVDLGCGDGRVLLEASASRGCRAIGVESNPMLVADARRRMADGGPAGERVRIIEGDATAPGDHLEQGTVFFVFVPAEAAVDLIADLLVQANPGSRIIAHEQHRLPGGPAGATMTPLLAADAATVGYCWTVGTQQ